jgi:hypothetical protein
VLHGEVPDEPDFPVDAGLVEERPHRIYTRAARERFKIRRD